MIFVVMGVSGCGKTTVGAELAAKLGWLFADADDFHSDANKTKMANGCPLTDQDRIPWLSSIHEQMDRWNSLGQNAVITCSALKRFYRRILLSGLTDESVEANDIDEQNESVRDLSEASSEMNTCCHGIINCATFIFLKVSEEILLERLKKRSNHFMPPSLLQSQLHALEEPRLPERFFIIDGNRNQSEVIQECLTSISNTYKRLGD